VVGEVLYQMGGKERNTPLIEGRGDHTRKQNTFTRKPPQNKKLKKKLECRAQALAGKITNRPFNREGEERKVDPRRESN